MSGIKPRQVHNISAFPQHRDIQVQDISSVDTLVVCHFRESFWARLLSTLKVAECNRGMKRLISELLGTFTTRETLVQPEVIRVWYLEITVKNTFNYAFCNLSSSHSRSYDDLLGIRQSIALTAGLASQADI